MSIIINVFNRDRGGMSEVDKSFWLEPRLLHATRTELREEICRLRISNSRLTGMIVRLRDDLAKEQAKNSTKDSTPATPEGN